MFLDTVATDLYARYGDNISELTLVFPNRRAHLFFSKSLSKIIAKPVWQPVYKSIEELIEEAAPWRAADTFTLLVELYEVYCAERKTTEAFDRFYYWGETLLHDFDQIDRYRVNAAALFTNLRHAKEMEGDFSFLTPEQVAHIQRFWETFSTEKDNRLQQDFVAIWDVLLNIYTTFNARLQAKGIAYEGMLYRAVADRLTDSLSPADGGFPGRYVFIGFNALNECEKALFRFLQKNERADFYWDYDAYYIDDTRQEAGLFLRENIKNFPSPIIPNSSFSILHSQFSIISAPSDVAQAKVVPQLLKAMTDAPDERTAVVLADEQLLIPLLHALPTVAPQINITMGYPLRQTAVYSLVELLLQLFTHAKTAADKSVTYYYQDVQALLAHPYVQQLLRDDPANYPAQLLRWNRAYVPYSFFTDGRLSRLLQPVSNYREAANCLLSLVDMLSVDTALNQAEPLLRGLLQHVVRQVNQLTTALAASSIDVSLKLYSRLLRSVFRNEHIPFTGEPLAGVQVLGLLETRSLDFENVIVLSANEGVLPRAPRTVSFIPYNLRRGFGLPTPEQQEAVSAYYFYRLLQRAEQVKLVYNSKTDGITTGEMSRYLLQLKLESGREVHEETLSFDVDIPETKPIAEPKTEAVQAIERLSPSALNMYLACPLRFYFRHVAYLKEPDEVAERVDSRLFGNLLHRAMELIYKPWLGQEVTEDMLNALLKKPAVVMQLVNEAIAREYYKSPQLPPDFSENGDLRIVHEILCRYVRQLLLIDKKQTPFVPEGIEQSFEETIYFTVAEQPQQLLLGGIVDRLHRKGSTWYVVDYKTGRPDNEWESIAELFGSDARKQHPAVLQTLLYAWMVHRQKQQPVVPLLYFLRESHSDAADFTIYNKQEKQPVTDIATYAEALEQALKDKLAELFDPTQPFVQTADAKTCEYCAYKTICNKNNG